MRGRENRSVPLFLSTREIQLQDKVRNLDSVDIASFRLHRIAHFIPMKNRPCCIRRIWSLDQQIHFGIPDKLQRLMR